MILLCTSASLMDIRFPPVCQTSTIQVHFCFQPVDEVTRWKVRWVWLIVREDCVSVAKKPPQKNCSDLFLHLFSLRCYTVIRQWQSNLGDQVSSPSMILQTASQAFSSKISGSPHKCALGRIIKKFHKHTCKPVERCCDGLISSLGLVWFYYFILQVLWFFSSSRDHKLFVFPLCGWVWFYHMVLLEGLADSIYAQFTRERFQWKGNCF